MPSCWILREFKLPFKEVRPLSEQYKMSFWRSSVSHEELGAQAGEELMSDSEYESVWFSCRDNVLTVPE